MMLQETKPVSGFHTPAKPIYEREPLRQILALPPIDPKNKMTVAQYEEHCKQKSFGHIGSDLVLKGVILEEIEKRPQIWKARARLSRLKDSVTEVAVCVFRRTGVILRIETIQKFFKQTKDKLRLELRKSNNSNRSLLDIEKRLYGWELYGFARFLRPSFTNYENKLSKKNVIELSSDSESESDSDSDNSYDNGMRMEEVSEDRELQQNETVPQVGEKMHLIHQENQTVVGDERRMHSFCQKQGYPHEFHPSSFSTAQYPPPAYPSMPPSYSHTDPQSYHISSQHGEPSLVRPIPNRIDYVLPESEVLLPKNTRDQKMEWFTENPAVMANLGSESSSSPMTQFMPYQPPVLPPITQSDITQINEQIFRVGRNQPHKVPLLRKALFDLILQFDLKDYTSVKELFGDLSRA